MLIVTLREGDYIMIGDNIKVQYDHMNGKDHLALAIDAPKDLSILRGKVYEEALEKKAETGDLEAQALSKKLKKEYAARRRKANLRRLHHDKLQAQGM